MNPLFHGSEQVAGDDLVRERSGEPEALPLQIFRERMVGVIPFRHALEHLAGHRAHGTHARGDLAPRCRRRDHRVPDLLERRG